MVLNYFFIGSALIINPIIFKLISGIYKFLTHFNFYEIVLLSLSSEFFVNRKLVFCNLSNIHLSRF